MAGVDLILGDEHISGPDFSTGKQTPGSTVRTKQGKEVKADYVFVAVGNTPNTQLVQKADPGAVGDKGLIKVNDQLQVRPRTSLFSSSSSCQTLQLKSYRRDPDQIHLLYIPQRLCRWRLCRRSRMAFVCQYQGRSDDGGQQPIGGDQETGVEASQGGTSGHGRPPRSERRGESPERRSNRVGSGRVDQYCC